MPNLIRAAITIWVMIFLVNVGIAQENSFVFDTVAGTQEYTGAIENPDSDEILVYLDNLKAGDTVYAMAFGADEIDPYLIVTNPQGTSSYAQDNDSGGGFDAALAFPVAADGNYILGMFSINGTGNYRLVVGINDPTVIAERSLESVGAEIGNSISGNDTYIGRRDEVRRFAGIFNDSSDEILVVFRNLQVGDVIYAYAAGLGFVDTYLEVLNQGLSETFAEDDDSGGGYNAVVSYEVETDGTYTVRLTTIDQIGNYEITAGVNTPEVLDLINDPTAITLPEGGFDCTTVDQLGFRPNLSGFDRNREGETYVIHYTLDGTDATTEDYVDAMVEALDRSLDIQFNELGWLPPPADCGEGGDSRLDVYVVDLDGTAGIGVAIPEGVVGNNPATERQEFFATYSFLLVENDMSDYTGTAALDLMRSTVAHEVHHNIQFGYDFNDSYHGFYEAGATWIETLVYPTANTVYEYVGDVFYRPDVCIGRISTDLREYGEWLMIDSFVRDLGADSYQFIWEFIGTRQGLPGFYAALRELDTTPQQVIERMAIRNLLRDYALGKRFTGTVFVEAEIDGTGFVTPSRTGVQELSVDYVAITDDGRYTFELTDGANLTMFVVGIDTEAGTAAVYDIGQRGTVDTTQYDEAYVIVLNTTEHANSDNCDYTNWRIRVSNGASDTLSTADANLWNASQFVRAR
jgi:hypothetical protein